MIHPSMTADLCLKCNLCATACPVAAVTDLFPGPKDVGPQAQRFRHPHLPTPDISVEWCSGCGTCSQVCPHGVSVAEMNIQAKARMAIEKGVPLRDHLISRPALLGRIVRPISSLANFSLNYRPARMLFEKMVGVSHQAALPVFAKHTLQKRLQERYHQLPPDPGPDTDRTVAFFYGCSNNYYEPELGELAVAILEYFGQKVVLPPQVCCGLPLQSNGLFKAARRQAKTNISCLVPFAQRGIPIVGTSTSCVLSLKHDYRVVLGLMSEDTELVASSTFDFFEFLTFQMAEELKSLTIMPQQAKALYHPSCQLRSHGIGAPAHAILQRIPQLELHLSESNCCGVAGTYGMKREKYNIAFDVGRTLFKQASRLEVDFVICDSETCRWWIAKHTQLPVYHPLQILARALGIS